MKAITMMSIMMARLWMRICLCSVMIMGAWAMDMREGKEYFLLKNPIPNAKNTVIEVFNYTCPFCYKYAKILPSVIATLPNDVEVLPYHLRQKGEYGALASEVFAVLFIMDKHAHRGAFDAQSLFHKAQQAYFINYHEKKNRWKEGEDSFITTGLKAAGVSEAAFNDMRKSEEVRQLLSAWEASYEIALVQGIPAFVINGKYLIAINALTSVEDLGKKMRYLLEKE